MRERGDQDAVDYVQEVVSQALVLASRSRSIDDLHRISSASMRETSVPSLEALWHPLRHQGGLMSATRSDHGGWVYSPPRRAQIACSDGRVRTYQLSGFYWVNFPFLARAAGLQAKL